MKYSVLEHFCKNLYQILGIEYCIHSRAMVCMISRIGVSLWQRWRTNERNWTSSKPTFFHNPIFKRSTVQLWSFWFSFRYTNSYTSTSYPIYIWQDSLINFCGPFIFHKSNHPSFLRPTGPTVVINQVFDNEKKTSLPENPTETYLCYPESNSLLVFDGRLAHGVLDASSTGIEIESKVLYYQFFFPYFVYSKITCFNHKICLKFSPKTLFTSSSWCVHDSFHS